MSQAAPYPFDLGRYRRATSTPFAEAQRWFDRGLVWSYAFNHGEAIRCFERAIACDEDFALAHWGVAYASGPNYNKQWDAFDDLDLRRSLRRSYDDTIQARELAAGAWPVEQRLIAALGERYASPEPSDDLDRWTAAYAQAMGDVYAAHSGDLDVAALYADALMNVTAWSLWDLETGEPADGAHTLEARRVLETALARPGGDGHPLYRVHNHHFRIYGAMFAGRRGTALAAADALAASIPEDLLRVEVPPMADWLESFVPMRLHVLVRFGLWEEIIAEPLPADPGLYCVSAALTRYAKGVAFAATSCVADAEREREAFAAAVSRVPESRYLFNNTARDILAVAGAMLDGELEYRRGNHEEAWRHLRRAIELDDTLPYDEPWGWMQPTRHAYGALLLEQGEVESAAAVYAADLGLDATLPRACQHPSNVWSLDGYHECLSRLGRTDEARGIKPQLDRALAQADIEITSSCFCRMRARSPLAGT
ncbi:MAG TPA: hypothetical protein VG371_04590 [Solirubrobacteraceae bacterium]|nr:hypothetical protein [Solirubrobacteraceae bacterium]